MKYFIFHKKKINEADILITALSPENLLFDFKFPGILKSKKRSSYLLTPGTIWDLTLSQESSNQGSWKIPREMQLITNPFEQEIEYEDLEYFVKLLEPLHLIVKKEALNIYSLLEQISLNFKTFDARERLKFQTLLYFNILHQMGRFAFQESCALCEKSLIKEAENYYFADLGSICQDCIAEKRLIKKEGLLQQLIESLTNSPNQLTEDKLITLSNQLAAYIVHN